MGRYRYLPPPEHKVRKLATDFWFAVQRMARRREGPPPLPEPPPDDQDDGDVSESGVPRRPNPSSGSASAAVPELDEDATR